MKTIRSIAVVGATGMLGAYTTNKLTKKGYSVTAVVRDMQKAQSKLTSAVHLVKGDLKDINSLLTAFYDVDYVYLSLSTGPSEKNAEFKTEIDGLKNVIEAAKRAKIKRIGFLSSLVKDYNSEEGQWWIFDIKQKATDMLKEADIPTTIFYPSSFYENLTELQLSGNRVLLAGRQLTQSWWIGTSDYSTQVAAAFNQDHTEDREYPIQGPEPYSMDEAADIFIKNYPHKKLKKIRAPMWIFKLLKPFSKQIDFQYNILNAINHYDEAFQSEKTWKELGGPQQTLADWAKQNEQT